MDSDSLTDPGLIKAQITRVIKDFSQYLFNQKQIGNTFFDLSEESNTLINNWGTKSPSQNFFFQGHENASVFIIDSETQFFRGESGKLLIKILKAMKLSSDSIFICNADDLKSVHEKINVISPKIIITLGTKAGQSLLKIKSPLEQFRGRFHKHNGILVMPTFHPSLLLKQPEYKRQVWEDMKLVMENAGLKDDA
ncbi:MAG: uracil-DNA glycosylase [Desulfobacula sp.]|jgi:uracil-DNA glycosylase|nr:uracil-DNA glycosylase [Desulfobacula sp.]MBT6338845.1 uracil-DNA glycosylase [Desulfobacula sp.]